jgi:periplasmic copper chaperone A
MRPFLTGLAMLASLSLPATPIHAQTAGDAEHLTEAGGLRVLHVWTPATSAGSEALLYMEIENRSASGAFLTGGEAMGQPLDLVGFTYGAGGESWSVLPGLPIPAGAEADLEPKVMALRWSPVPVDLVEGADLHIAVTLDGARLQVEAEIGAPDAKGHSHAGHTH